MPPLPRDGAASATMGSTEILGGSVTGASNVGSSMTADDMETDEAVDLVPPSPPLRQRPSKPAPDLATAACADDLDPTRG